jgi:amino acid transporter
MEPLEERKIEIGQDTLKNLNTTRKWTLFLSILGFIAIGVLLVLGLFTGVFLSVFNTVDPDPRFPEWLTLIIIVLLALVFYFPVVNLFRFSKNTSEAVKTFNKQKLDKAFKNLKAYYVYTGILIIVALIIYLIVIIVTGASMGFVENL